MFGPSEIVMGQYLFIFTFLFFIAGLGVVAYQAINHKSPKDKKA